ncbi:hypothetical protein Goari_016032, partial [Gossypium aridum]|nr:hypothetical protein [Gossypium aridum]
MELQQHIGHLHPLVFNQEMNHQSEETFCCFGCNRKVKGLSFIYSECGFFLHKGCALSSFAFYVQHFLFFEDNINSHCVLVVVIEIPFTNAKIVTMLW